MIDIREHGGIFGDGNLKLAAFTPSMVFDANPQTKELVLTGLTFKPAYAILYVHELEGRNGSTATHASGAIFWPMADDPNIVKRGVISHPSGTADDTILQVTDAIYSAGTVTMTLNKSGGSVSAQGAILGEVYFVG